jgi:hypothetical protein
LCVIFVIHEYFLPFVFCAVCLDFTAREREHVGEEMSDILLYLIRLSDRCGIDLSAAVLDKMEKNAKKYPAHIVKGSCKKYDEYDTPSAPTSTPTSTTDAAVSHI